MTPAPRKIIHCDCDCFYAAVEMRDDPSLRMLPIAVGGRANQRGVIATCNYEARRFGVRSAMATGHALKLCPDLVLIPPSFEKYREASKQILAIYNDYTDLIEPLSLDEAYLDVTNAAQCQGSASLIAREIRSRIAKEVGITASAGIAPNKFIAKIASDWNKPNGQFVVTPDQVDEFVAQLPVDKLFGVGKVTAEKMKRLGAYTCADLRTWSPPKLQQQFGRFGERLYELCRGIDTREVNPSRERKSISVEETYPNDVPSLAACRQQLPHLLEKLRERIQRARAEHSANKLFLKIRFADFSRTTVECAGSIAHTAASAQSSLSTQVSRFEQLLETGFQRGKKPVRLLGVGVRLAADRIESQLELFS
ncbi:MAG: DNA polymerase IV [Spongiibacteraceae bacterium]